MKQNGRVPPILHAIAFTISHRYHAFTLKRNDHCGTASNCDSTFDSCKYSIQRFLNIKLTLLKYNVKYSGVNQRIWAVISNHTVDLRSKIRSILLMENHKLKNEIKRAGSSHITCNNIYSLPHEHTR